MGTLTKYADIELTFILDTDVFRKNKLVGIERTGIELGNRRNAKMNIKTKHFLAHIN